MIRRWVAAATCAAALACSPIGADASGAEPSTAAPPRSRAEALLTRYTWPGLDGHRRTGWEPRDECGTLDGSYAFRMALAEAVLARDEQALLGLVSLSVMLGFGGDSGHEDLKRQLRDDGLWDELEALLPLGCATNSDAGLTIPWYFAQDLGDVDYYVAFFVIGKGVAMRAGPDPAAPLVASLDWALLEQGEGLAANGFEPVKTADGRSGFVARRFLRPALDYRLLAEREEDGWQVTVIAVGD